MAANSPTIPHALRVERVVKAYGATVALDGMSFEVAPGEVHALLGENGAGKSTTVKMLSGLVQPDQGGIELFGQPVRLGEPLEAQRHGVQTAYQEMTLVRDLTVAENMLLPHAPTGLLGQLRRREGERRVVRHLAALGLDFIDPRAEIRDLDLPVRQKIEIARAVFRKPRILLLDEPTSSLSGRDIDWLGELIRRVTQEGVTVVFISHRMPEVRLFCDRLTVLRNGKEVGTATVDAITDDEVVRMIIGRSLAATFPPKAPPRARNGVTPFLEARDLSVGSRLKGASFALHPGEILGIAGLQGMGQQQLFLSCFGMAPPSAGQILIDGREVTLASPQDAIRANIGISLVPEDRKTEGLFLKMDGRSNVALPVIERFTKGGLIDGKAETDAVARVFRQVEVDPRALYTPAGAFSGGNQQKIAIGKWLLAGSRTLLMFDPTRGVDIGTKHQLYLLMRAFADAGGAVLFYSTEIAELVNLCDRVLVMYGGRIVSELAGEAIEEEAIMRSALGEQRGAAA
ncbi:sugar ABC transporter ATP-binding protein [Geminicoccus roseus]|uniref:sugar ABC transporter ATP-binding protein n=1 Tax=Geminicoccus roseus TaxID=404900 RepID=UPI00040FB627|nr:sugar ABC transporter ATP-binding protein [Geminicoccus roseus]